MQIHVDFHVQYDMSKRTKYASIATTPVPVFAGGNQLAKTIFAFKAACLCIHSLVSCWDNDRQKDVKVHLDVSLAHANLARHPACIIHEPECRPLMTIQSDLPSHEASTNGERITATTTGGSSGGSGCRSSGSVSSASFTATEIVESGSSDTAAGVVVVLSSRLAQVQRDSWKVRDVVADDDRTDDENNEENEHEEVQDRVADDSSLA